MNIVVSPVNTIFVTRTVLLQVPRNQFGHFLLVHLDFNVHSTGIVKLHRMHEMQIIVTNVHSLSVCLSHGSINSASLWGHLVQPLPNHFGLL